MSQQRNYKGKLKHLEIHLEWINDKILMYSTGNYTEYPVISHNGKEYKKNIYM